MQIDLAEAKQALDRRAGELRALCETHAVLPLLQAQSLDLAEDHDERKEREQEACDRLQPILSKMRDEWKASGELAIVVQQKINAQIDTLIKYRAAELSEYFTSLKCLIQARVEAGNILSKYVPASSVNPVSVNPTEYPETEFGGVLRRFLADPERFHSDPAYQSGALERGDEFSRVHDLLKARLATTP